MTTVAGEDPGAGQGSGSDGNPTAAGAGAGSPAAANPGDELVPIGQVRALQGTNDKLRGRLAELEGQLGEQQQGRQAAEGQAAAASQAGLGHLRRALIAEAGGQLVEELVQGDSEEALRASLETAKAAYGRAEQAARERLQAERIPAGAPTRDAAAAGGEDVQPMDRIREGLKEGGS